MHITNKHHAITQGQDKFPNQASLRASMKGEWWDSSLLFAVLILFLGHHLRPGPTGELSYPSNNIPKIVTEADRNHLHIIDGFVTSWK